MLSKPCYSLSQVSDLTKYSLEELLYLILQNNEESVYFYSSYILLAIPQSQLNRIQVEYGLGQRSHLVEMWHPYLTHSSIAGEVYMTFLEFKSRVSEKECFSYNNAVNMKCTEMHKSLSDTYSGKRKIYTKAEIKVEELVVMRDCPLVESLFATTKTHYQNLFQLPFLDKSYPGYSTQLAAGVECWLDLNVNNLRKPHLSLVNNAEAIIKSKFPEIDPTPRSRIASWMNNDNNKKTRKSDTKKTKLK